MPPERRHPGTLEEEVVKVFLRIRTEGVVLISEHAVAVKEAPGSDVTMPDGPEKDTDFDGCEVVPIDLCEWNGAAGGLQHFVDGAGLEAPLSAPRAGARRRPRRRPASLAPKAANSYAATELSRSCRGSTSAPKLNARATVTVGSM